VVSPAFSRVFFHVENAPYVPLSGIGTAAGMPFKEIATSDSIYMHTNPPSSDKEGRPALRRMMEVTVGVIVPAEVRMKDLLDNAVAIMSFEEAL
jgi:(E)-4-hydroxy-3-methylbut-2-enyl-diphosphate synthase